MTKTHEYIFVFGSNLAGIHGAGAAKYAKEHYGAVQGKGVGHWGNSYAIPTKDKNIKTLPLQTIDQYVQEFHDYALANSGLVFVLTPIGTGLAGYTKKEMWSLLRKYKWPNNVVLHSRWIND